MMTRSIVVALAILLTLGALTAQRTLLPSEWTLSPPAGNVAVTGTFPQGIALSPDGAELAVVEGGYNPPALRVLDAGDLHVIRTVALKDAFGEPVWRDARHVLVAGGSTDTVALVDIEDGSIASQPAGSWTAAVAFDGATVYSASDLRDSLVARKSGERTSWATGAHPAAIAALTPAKIYVANRGEASVWVLPSRETIAVDLHPAALALSADKTRLYVACSDADAIDVIDTKTDTVVQRIDVGLSLGRGASPNGLAVASDGTLYVSLGAENAVAEVRDGRVIARAPAGWYPTGVVVDERNVYVVNGRGESSHANPGFTRANRSQYVGSLVVGSVRAIPRDEFNGASTADVLANIPSAQPTPAQTIVRAHGPIEHIIYIIKENRTYDQVLGDVKGANGDPSLVWFGENITPNQHAIARRFGVFDNTYTDAQVSASGHNWSDAAFANDYVERFWPPNYGGRRPLYDFEDGATGAVPGTGYLWDDAGQHGVSLRDYGEHTSPSLLDPQMTTTSTPGLKGKVDPRYRGWNLSYSDELRVDEWQREFKTYVTNGDLPALQIVWLPNDHTAGTAPGALTPQSMVAQNDHAFGRVVDAVSHSSYWKNTVILSIEDDAQNGPDHVDDQRTTFYIASAYAAPGVHHAHYSTSSIVRTIELFLGLPPMNIYDATAPPLYDAFALQADMKPYDVIAPRIDDTLRNTRTAYGAEKSAQMNLSREDAVDPKVMNDILAHAARSFRR